MYVDRSRETEGRYSVHELLPVAVVLPVVAGEGIAIKNAALFSSINR
jgi:hypothetical protein